MHNEKTSVFPRSEAKNVWVFSDEAEALTDTGRKNLYIYRCYAILKQ